MKNITMKVKDEYGSVEVCLQTPRAHPLVAAKRLISLLSNAQYTIYKVVKYSDVFIIDAIVGFVQYSIFYYIKDEKTCLASTFPLL